MAVLTPELKREIVEALACFKRPAEVAVMMMADHGLEIDVKQIVTYDPTRSTFQSGEDLRTIFEAARKNYLEDVQSVPIANQGYRLKILQENLTAALKQGNKILANATLEQAAKEVGGVLTNERNVKLDRTSSPLSELTPEERRSMVADMLTQALDKHKKQNAASTETAQ